jgi:hypothetical protein
MSGTSRKDEDKRKRSSSLGDLAREIFGVPSPRESQGSNKKDDIYNEFSKRMVRKEEILRWLGIYFLASLPILFVFPPILVYFHLISKAMVGLISALWIELYLANTVGASGYLLEVRNCWDIYYCDGDLVDKAELIFALYLLLCIAFFIIEPFIFGSI